MFYALPLCPCCYLKDKVFVRLRGRISLMLEPIDPLFERGLDRLPVDLCGAGYPAQLDLHRVKTYSLLVCSLLGLLPASGSRAHAPRLSRLVDVDPFAALAAAVEIGRAHV